MDYFNLNNEQKKEIYREFKSIVESSEYKNCIKEYDSLITNISLNLDNMRNYSGPVIALLIASFIKDGSFSKNKQLFIEDDCLIENDLLYHLWGSKVCAGVISDRHIVSFVNDILIRMNYFSCKLPVCKESLKFSIINNFKNNKNDNGLILCVIDNNKRIYIDLKSGNILKPVNNYNKKYSCYKNINYNGDKEIYYLNNLNYDELFDLNSDHLFTMNNYVFSDDFSFNCYTTNNKFYQYLFELFNKVNNDFYNKYYDKINLISELNQELLKKQNDIYKRIKK